ncbi:MAG: ABC transporter permease [Bacteroides sp.]|nr:ABC transporter permease [Bacteroides sp.]MBD5306166.1 ABC transporter permease [Bacteroides sp.]
MNSHGFREGFRRSALQILRRPIYWVGILLLPLFCTLLLTTEMEDGLPIKVPAGLIDNDGTSLSREVSQSLGSMEMVDITEDCSDFTEARHKMQEGKIFGYFLIPENFESDLLAGRGPAITFYTNMTYFVPGSLLFKAFKTTAVYTKAGVVSMVAADAGVDTANASAMMMPVNIQVRGLGNPGLNYAIYLCNSFVPAVFQLMIFLMTCFSIGETIKHGFSRRLLEICDGSVLKFIGARLLPQTLIWILLIVFMESWLYGWMGYPMHGSWLWMTLNNILLVLSSQAFGLFIVSIFPNLRLSLSLCALTGILSFSIAAFSFPYESMYGGIAVFSWILPIRYNFLIYIDQALNGIDIYYSRWWFVAYFIFILAPLPFLGRLRKALRQQVYVP